MAKDAALERKWKQRVEEYRQSRLSIRDWCRKMNLKKPLLNTGYIGAPCSLSQYQQKFNITKILSCTIKILCFHNSLELAA